MAEKEDMLDRLSKLSSHHGVVSYEDWKTCWDKNILPWQKDHFNGFLMNNQERLLGRRKGLKIFVPFCGKSLDLLWFAEQGHNVIGLEYVAKPIEDFFNENGISYVTEAVPGMQNATLYKARDKSIMIYRCDFYELSREIECDFDIVWDNSAFGAANKSERERYVSLMTSLLTTEGRILLCASDYDGSKYGGPPMNVPTSVVQQMYGENFTVELLETRERPDADKKAFNLDKMEWRAHLLCRKQ